jgi:LPXTG-site transpeptidase (sortase) family protein
MNKASGKIILGLALIALGLTIGATSLVYAREGDDWWKTTSSIHREATDMQMFGKTLSIHKFAPDLALDQLKAGSGPIVPTRLRVPSLGIDANIEDVGVRSNGEMDVPGNVWNAGWLNTSVRPGEVGNAVMAGHLNSLRGGAVFLQLDKLNVGDKIYVSDKWGWELTFEVAEKAAYEPANAPLDRIFGNSSDRMLNLITCTGDFIPNELTYNKRLVVYTKLVQ